MRILSFIPLLFLTACSSTTPQLVLRQRTSPPVTDSVRYPETVHAYHIGRYVDPNDDLVMHGRHVVYRVEENSRWNLRSSPPASSCHAPASAKTITTPHNVAFSPLPVSDAELAEINAQKLATIQILAQARTLSAAIGKFQLAWEQTETNLQETAALRATVSQLQIRIEALATAQKQPHRSPLSTTNEPDLLQP